LTQHRDSLDALASALLARESLDEREIIEVTGLRPVPSVETGRLVQPRAEGDNRLPSR
jgi:cell division protease FtsH